MKKSLTLITCIAIFLCSFFPAFSQGWIKDLNFNFTNNYFNWYATQIPNGNYFMLRMIRPAPWYQFEAVKFNANGDSIAAYRVAIDTMVNAGRIFPVNGGYIICGIYQAIDGYVFRTDTAFNLIWDKHLPQLPVIGDCVRLPNEDVVVAGGMDDLVITKVSGTGNIVWNHTIQIDTARYFGTTCLIHTNDGGFAIGGFSTVPNNPALKDSSYLIKTDSSGNLEWIRNLGGDRVLTSLRQFTDNTYIMVINDFGQTHIVRSDSAGNIVPSNYVGVSDHPLEITADGGFVYSGSDIGSGETFEKRDHSGNLVWTRNYNSIIRSIEGTSDGGFILVSSKYIDTLTTKMYLIKTDSLGRATTSVILGNVFGDMNSNCTEDSGETNIRRWMLELTGNLNQYAVTDYFGNFSFPAPTGSYTVTLTSPHPYWDDTICGTNPVMVNLQGMDTAVVGFPVQPVIACPDLHLSICSGILRRCFSTSYTFAYCNEGTIAATNPTLVVEFDPYLVVDSSSVPWQLPQTGNTYVFQLDSLDPGACGSISVFLTVDCSATLGQTHCVEAHIYPDSICLPANPAWDGASITLSDSCVNNDSVLFHITNTGMGNMASPLDYVVYADSIVLVDSTFQLNSGVSLTLTFPANGATYTLQAEQSTGHPGNSHPLISLEGCGTNPSGSFSTGFVTRFPQDDGDSFISIICAQNRGSYDPNDKTVSPEGFGEAGIIDAGQALKYAIRFQNTGTDTAFTVVVRDTLSNQLDISTLELGAASHGFTFRILQNRVLEWTFNNILLPDSNINEAGSHGYFAFTVSQIKDLAPGSVVKNDAAIYFDYNLPVITNQTINTIGNVHSFLLSTKEVHLGQGITVYPNPADELVTVVLQDGLNEHKTLTILDISGKGLRSYSFSGSTFQAPVSELKPGVYLFRITSSRATRTGKFVVN